MYKLQHTFCGGKSTHVLWKTLHIVLWESLHVSDMEGVGDEKS